MRGEVADAFRKGMLPGALHVEALRAYHGSAAGILARTASGTHVLTGFHDARVLFIIITEAQDPRPRYLQSRNQRAPEGS